MPKSFRGPMNVKSLLRTSFLTTGFAALLLVGGVSVQAYVVAQEQGPELVFWRWCALSLVAFLLLIWVFYFYVGRSVSQEHALLAGKSRDLMRLLEKKDMEISDLEAKERDPSSGIFAEVVDSIQHSLANTVDDLECVETLAQDVLRASSGTRAQKASQDLRKELTHSSRKAVSAVRDAISVLKALKPMCSDGTRGFETVSLEDMLRELCFVLMFGQNKELSIETEFDHAMPRVKTDKAALGKALFTYLKEAAKGDGREKVFSLSTRQIENAAEIRIDLGANASLAGPGTGELRELVQGSLGGSLQSSESQGGCRVLLPLS